MLEDSLLNFADATSYSYMYMTGRAWSAGDVALPGRINQRIIIGGVEASPEHEFRTIDGGSWWRIRGGDGWHTGGAPAMEMHVIDPRSLHSNLKALISGAKNLQLKSSQSVTAPLETVIDTHYLSGVTTVGSIREMGLGTVGDSAETQLVDFEFWIHQDTGMPARILFHGVPPALPPLGILHLFEVDKLHPESIAAPPPEALTENIGLVAASRQAVVTTPDDPEDEGARREVDSAGSEQSESTDPPARGVDNGPQGPACTWNRCRVTAPNGCCSLCQRTVTPWAHRARGRWMRHLISWTCGPRMDCGSRSGAIRSRAPCSTRGNSGWRTCEHPKSVTGLFRPRC